nr:DAK2 domain-containing protein [Herbihabitans rhizosphaerae]
MQALDAAAIRQWAAGCVQVLNAGRDEINRINVYPVADADTGSNLLGTVRAGLEELLRAPADERTGAGTAVAVLARGALAGARGNSGVILSQLLRGFAEPLSTVDAIGPAELAGALDRAAELASCAVSDPVPGTMLSVAGAAARAGRDTGADDLDRVVTAAVAAAEKALAETPNQLAVLAEAGVVDAGGLGVVLILRALATVVAEGRVTPDAVSIVPPAPSDEHTSITVREAGSEAYGYEVMYLLDVTDQSKVDTLREELSGLGDCVSVAGDGRGLWTVHVHCNDIGTAIEFGVEAGRPHQIRVARFADGPQEQPSRFLSDRAVVVAVRGGGLAELFAAEGASVFTAADDEPDAYRLLDVITETGAAQVTVLPGDVGLTAVADEAAIRAVAGGQDVLVVPCSSPVQALAALAVHDPRRRAGDDVVSMAEAAAATRRGEVMIAKGEAITWVGACKAGDVLGFADGEVVIIEPGPAGESQTVGTARGVLRLMLASGGELVTAVMGVSAPAGLASELEEFVRHEHPEADLVCYDGGELDAVIMFGVE